MKRIRFWTWATSLVLIMFAAGCGGQTTNSEGGVVATQIAQPTAIPTVTPKPAAKLTGSEHACEAADARVAYIHSGDLRVTPVQFALAYPSILLPGALADKPYKLPEDTNSLGGTPVNPTVSEPSGGYWFTVCNTAHTASHAIYGIDGKLEQFAAYTDAANTWQFCDGYYQRSNGPFYGGCGGGLQLDEALHAAFPADATTGADVTANQTSTTTPPGGVKTPPLPVTLGPGQQLVFNLGLTPPQAIGFYTFGFNMSVDGREPTHISTMAPTLFDAKAARWGGKACSTKSAILNLIPTSDLSGKYVCPM